MKNQSPGKKLFIGGGDVFLQGRLRRADILVQGQRITKVGGFPRPRDAEVLDASGLLVLPGAIDNHVHFREPGLEEKEGYETGTKGALHGGVTTVLEVQNNPPFLLSKKALDEKISKVLPKAFVDFGLYGNLVEEALPNLGAMAPRLAGLKLFAGGSTGVAGIRDYGTIRNLLLEAGKAGKLVVCHCEDQGILDSGEKESEGISAEDHGLKARPKAAEHVCIAAMVELALDTGADIHFFHITTSRSAEIVKSGKKSGARVTASTCPHYLYFSSRDARGLGNLLKVNPGIRSQEDVEDFRRSFSRGMVDVFSTDHAPHFRAEKERPYPHAPSGIPSIDLFWPLLYTLVRKGFIDLRMAVAMAAENPAAIHGLADKGEIKEGYLADLAVVDTGTPVEVDPLKLPSRAGYSPYEGMELYGWPVFTVARGEIRFRRNINGTTDFYKGSGGRLVPVEEQMK